MADINMNKYLISQHLSLAQGFYVLRAVPGFYNGYPILNIFDTEHEAALFHSYLPIDRDEYINAFDHSGLSLSKRAYPSYPWKKWDRIGIHYNGPLKVVTTTFSPGYANPLTCLMTKKQVIDYVSEYHNGLKEIHIKDFMDQIPVRNSLFIDGDWNHDFITFMKAEIV